MQGILRNRGKRNKLKIIGTALMLIFANPLFAADNAENSQFKPSQQIIKPNTPSTNHAVKKKTPKAKKKDCNHPGCVVTM